MKDFLNPVRATGVCVKRQSGSIFRGHELHRSGSGKSPEFFGRDILGGQILLLPNKDKKYAGGAKFSREAEFG